MSRLFLVALPLLAPSIASAAGGAFAGPAIAGIPVEFVPFATVLLGVALFHHYTFPIAAGGALVIALYKGSLYNTAAALIGGAMAHTAFRARVHIGIWLRSSLGPTPAAPAA